MGLLNKLSEQPPKKPRAPRKPKTETVLTPAYIADAAEQLYLTEYDRMREHPDVVAQAKAYAAQRLADALALEAEARANAAKALSEKLASEAAAASNAALLDGRSQYGVLHAQLVKVVARLALGSDSSADISRRVAALTAFAAELRHASKGD